MKIEAVYAKEIFKGDRIALAEGEVSLVTSAASIKPGYHKPEKRRIVLSNGDVLMADRLTVFQKVCDI